MGQVISKIFLILFLVNFISACNYLTSREIDRSVKPTKKPDLQEDLRLNKLTEEEESTHLNFKYVYSRIIEPKCSICHDSSSKTQLESYDDVQRNLSRIRSAVFIRKTMPKLIKLTESEEKLLWNWLQLKAPYYSKNAPEDLPPLVPTYQSIYERIFVNRCIVCHKANDPKTLSLDKQFLLSPNSLKYDILVPGKPEKSSLFLSVEQVHGEEETFMPPASKGFKKLSVEELSVIKTWIENGAQD